MNLKEAMAKAIELARVSISVSDDVPVGAIILNKDGEVIATGVNQREMANNPVAHAEIVAIERAAKSLGSWRLEDCVLIVTLEPCAMCAGAIAQSRISRVVFGAWDEKAGAVGSQWDILRDPRQLNKPEVISGIMAKECGELLGEFFSDKR